jgi:hypothetical protein
MSRLSNLAFTYANDFFTDGAGAQLHRIYCAYALARFLDVSYIHSPLKEIGYHGLSALERNKEIAGLVERYNKIFTIPSDCTLPEVKKVYTVGTVDLDVVCSLRDKAKNSSEFYLLRMAYPYSIIDKHPQTFRYFKEVSAFETSASPVFRIAIHVRRGDLLIIDSERILPNSYYITTVLKIIEVLRKLDISFVCELYTELSSKTFVVLPEHHGMKDQITGPVTINPKDNCIEDFDVLPHLKKYINSDALESMAALATADLVVISHSKFSYFPALLNKKGIIVYAPYVHATPLEWLDVTHQASFQQRLIESCKRWKAERSQCLM